MNGEPAQEVPCAECGGAVTVDAHERERNDRHFCSRECFDEHRKERVEVTCENCGTSERVTKTRASEYRTCSRECAAALHRAEGTFAGESNPRHKEVDVGEMAQQYREGETLPDLAERFDLSRPQIAERLRDAGVEICSPGFPRDVETSFGLKVRSSHEKKVAELLHTADVGFEYEPEEFPGPYVPDFVLDDGTVVEVWGVDSEEYQNRRAEKEAWYHEHEHQLLGVSP